MQELVSIIIPVYNTEMYLRRCLDSVLSQTYKNIEIILINDGSTDDCNEICEEYKRKDKRIIYLNNFNQGVSESRNIGIRIAKGNYITFVDSDDYIDKEHIEVLMKDVKIYNADVVVGNYCMKNKCNEKIFDGNNYNYGNVIISNVESRFRLFKEFNSGKIPCYIWRIIIRKTALKKINEFDKDIRFWEDKLFCISLLLNINNIYFEEKITYNYFRGTDTCTTKKSNIAEKIYDILKVNNKILEMIKSNYGINERLESNISEKNLEVVFYFILKMYEYNVVKKENLKQLLENAELENLLLKINRKKLTILQKIKYHLISDANMFMIYLYYIIGFKCKNRIKEMIGKK